MAKRHFTDYSNALIRRVVEIYFEEKKRPPKQQINTRAIADRINKEFQEEITAKKQFTRESIYPCIAAALERQFLKMVPGRLSDLEQKMNTAFSLPSGKTYVIEGSPLSRQVVIDAVADRTKEIIVGLLAEGKTEIGLGIGAGSATLEFCRLLGPKLKDAGISGRALSLIALSAGCPPLEPELAPTSFFNIFPDHLVKERVGFFAEPLVTNADFQRICGTIWGQEIVKAKNKVDIIVTSMGYVGDPEDKLSRLYQQCGKSATLGENGYLGNIQYRAFSEKEAIIGKADDLRVATLFEIEELLKLKDDGKHIILMVRPGSTGKITKEKALLALIREFPVFSELFIDMTSAVRLLELAMLGPKLSTR